MTSYSIELIFWGNANSMDVRFCVTHAWSTFSDASVALAGACGGTTSASELSICTAHKHIAMAVHREMFGMYMGLSLILEVEMKV